MALGLCDPVKIFVKEEPHSLKKCEELRWRLICSVSVIDNIIARLLFGLQNTTEINSWTYIPSKPGLGFHDDGLRALYDEVSSAGDISSSDISGWDWSMTKSDFDADLQRRAELNQGLDSSWYKIARMHYLCMQSKVFLLSDGSMYEQTIPGVMPSGWYNTSSTNSFIRCLDSYSVQLDCGVARDSLWCIAMGDDCIERTVDAAHAIESYGRRGKVVKMYDTFTDSFEFCSQVWAGSYKAITTNGVKLFKRLLHQKPADPAELDMYVSQWRYNMRYNPPEEVNEFYRVLVESGWTDQLKDSM